MEKLFAKYDGFLESVLKRKDYKSFGFVKFENQEKAAVAIKATNGKEFHGRDIFVDLSKPTNKPDSSNRGNRNESRPKQPDTRRDGRSRSRSRQRREKDREREDRTRERSFGKRR